MKRNPDQPRKRQPRRPQLKEAERILWQGQPDFSQYLLREILPWFSKSVGITLAFAGGIWLVMHLFPSASVQRSNPKIPDSFLVWLIAILGGAMTIGVTALSIYEAGCMSYTITNRRGIISGELMSKGTPVDITLSSLRNARLVDFGNGYGTIIVGSGQTGGKFYCIRDARGVYAGNCNAAACGDTDEGVALPPGWATDPFFDRLGSDEKLLWTSGPDVMAFGNEYWRNGFSQHKFQLQMVIGLFAFMSILELIRGGSHRTYLHMILPMFGLSSLAMAGLAVAARGDARKVARTTLYGITNQRVLSYTQISLTAWAFLSLTLRDSQPSLTLLANGLGTIEFDYPAEAEIYETEGGHHMAAARAAIPDGLAYIRDAPAVLNIIETAKARSAAPPT